MVEPFFSEIEKAIVENIVEAKRSVRIAVAWFTNQNLFDLLLNKLKEGVDVDLIIRDDFINNSIDSLRWVNFIDNGGNLYFTTEAKKMHHKYCIINEEKVISGSYNWTYQAEKINQENVIVFEDKGLAEAFIANFVSLKENSCLVINSSLLNYRRIEEATSNERIFIDEEQKIANLVDSLESLLQEAEYYYMNKNYEDVIVTVNSIFKINKKNPAAFETLAWTLLRQGKILLAIKKAEEGLELDHTHAEFYNILGLAFSYGEDWSKAIKNFDIAISLIPENTVYYCNKILTLYKSGRESLCEKEIIELNKVAFNIIKNKDKHNLYTIVQAYINRGQVKSGRGERIKSAVKAKELFDEIPESERDSHTLDDINSLMNS